ncbi:rhomboid family intramembrane serine protease [uncultured Eudoraea sp.]|uniref:rhomboid family intramembrane serine protease n=1 Tax=uncultured Eudoraea sp. TaxID=1035614 RepID=UPI00260FF35D|nr:rhomboid family intramembrane serine protease [uncultured Eudoraea sp.]
MKISEVVKHLIIINVIVFLAVQALSFLPNLSLFFPASKQFAPYQLVTHMFSHGSIGHIAFNMLSLFFLGPYVERELGAKNFFTFYLLCGFGAMLAHILIDYISYGQLLGSVDSDFYTRVYEEGRSILLSGKNYTDPTLAKLNEVLNVPVVGASGAIYGVTLAFAYLFPNVELMLLFFPFPIKAKYLAIGIIIYDLFFGVSQFKTGIAHFAHLGGGLTGILLVMFFYKRRFNK